MQFLWFDWDDPKSSMLWSGSIILLGVALWIPVLKTWLGFGTPNLPRFVWEIVGLGGGAATLGLITLGLSAAAWLNSLRRQYR